MIIGSGLIANGFLDHGVEFNNAIIYAAGLSNSLCADEKEYVRDADNLKSALNKCDKNKIFVYISSCDVLSQKKSEKSRYITHKLFLESLVMQHQKYLIFRLPQVVGKSKNPNTLLNYLSNSIRNGVVMRIKKNAYRNIIDIRDVAKIGIEIINNFCKSDIINIANPKSNHILEIIQSMEESINITSKYIIIDGGESININVENIYEYIDLKNINFNYNYFDRTIKFYYK